MQRVTQFAFRVSDDERRAIADLAARLQRSQSDAIRFVVTEAARQLTEPHAGGKNKHASRQRPKMQSSLQNDRPAVGTADLPEQVKRSTRISSLSFIVADEDAQAKHQAEALAAAYRFIPSPEWGKA